MSEIERIRESFRPPRITTLFVGESAPQSGKFFYLGNSQVYWYMQEAFGGGEDFLAWFKTNGFFLDDLILIPANKIADKRERQQLGWDSVPSLAERLSRYQPAMVVALMKAIDPMVRAAMAEAGLSDLPFESTPFPGNGQQGNFRSKMAEIIHKFPRLES